MDQDLRINWRNADSSTGVNWAEVQANYFAAELLMPTRFLLDDLDYENLNDDLVIRLANRYQVIEQAMRNRLVNLGIVDPI